jgi:hypothetical protein
VIALAVAAILVLGRSAMSKRTRSRASATKEFKDARGAAAAAKTT